jgi:hypothetical protein
MPPAQSEQAQIPLLGPKADIASKLSSRPQYVERVRLLGLSARTMEAASVDTGERERSRKPSGPSLV